MTGYSDIETNYSGNYKKMDMKKTKVALVTASLLALLSGCNDNSSSAPAPQEPERAFYCPDEPVPPEVDAPGEERMGKQGRGLDVGKTSDGLILRGRSRRTVVVTA